MSARVKAITCAYHPGFLSVDYFATCRHTGITATSRVYSQQEEPQ
jgi:hypothetical protein